MINLDCYNYLPIQLLKMYFCHSKLLLFKIIIMTFFIDFDFPNHNVSNPLIYPKFITFFKIY